MTKEELSNLKQGDVVRHEPSGADCIVLTNVGGVPTVLRSIQLHTGPDWSHVYTPTPVVVPPVPSIVEMIKDLQELGWTFNEPLNEWFSPDKIVHTRVIKSAWLSRNSHPAPTTPSHTERVTDLTIAGWRYVSTLSDNYPCPPLIQPHFAESRAALLAAGWRNARDNVWMSPDGSHFEGAFAAYVAMTQGGNPS